MKAWEFSMSGSREGENNDFNFTQTHLVHRANTFRDLHPQKERDIIIEITGTTDVNDMEI